MTVQDYNLVWEQGADLTFTMIYKAGANLATAVPVDLTGYEVRMDISNSVGVRIYTFNSALIADTEPDTVGDQEDSTLEATLGADGRIAIKVPRSLTLTGGPVHASVLTGNSVFNYDVFLRNNENPKTQKKILKGTVVVNPSVTAWA